MTKDAFYFSHDSNAKTDPDIVRLRMAHGWEGYGIYWAIVEMLRDEETHKMQTEYNCIAFALNVHEEKVKSIICDFDLFEVDDGLFWSASLIRRMKKRKEVSEQRKAAAKKRWENKDLNANALQKQSKCNAVAIQGKERKGKERKGNNTYCDESVFTAPRSGLEKEICDALSKKYKDRLLSLNSKVVEKLISNLADPVFSGVNVPAEISKAAIWEDSNPTKRKTPKGTSKFLTQWMTRCQDDGARNRARTNDGKKIGHLAPVKYEGMYD